MKTVNRFADVLNKNLALLSVLVALFALVVPSFWVNLAGSVSLDLSWVPFMGQYFSSLGFVNLLLGVIMFGMGMTLRAEDFALILRLPRHHGGAALRAGYGGPSGGGPGGGESVCCPGHQACQGSRWFCGSRGGVRAIPYII